MKECITHHFACDCREAEFKALLDENAELREALEFYANRDNRCAELISQAEFEVKYFPRAYIVDVFETEYCKDSGKRAEAALTRSNFMSCGPGPWDGKPREEAKGRG